jgi:hypothetical protein
MAYLLSDNYMICIFVGRLALDLYKIVDKKLGKLMKFLFVVNKETNDKRKL